MGQTHSCVYVKPIQNSLIIETDSLLKSSDDDKPPDIKPLQKNIFSAGAKFTELKLKEHRAGAHSFVMVSCVH